MSIINDKVYLLSSNNLSVLYNTQTQKGIDVPEKLRGELYNYISISQLNDEAISEELISFLNKNSIFREISSSNIIESPKYDLSTVLFISSRESLYKTYPEHLKLMEVNELIRDIFIVDDSVISRQKDIENLVHSTKKANRMDTYHIHKGIRKELSQILQENSSASNEVINFLLYGLPEFQFKAGAVRNTALLLTPDKQVLSLDDDEYPFWIRKDNSECLISSLPPVYTITTQKKIANTADLEHLNLIKSISQYSSITGDKLEINLNPDDSLLLDQKKHFTVPVSIFGCAGDSGMATSYPFLFLEDKERKIIENKKTYISLMNSRYNTRFVDVNTFTTYPLVTTGCYTYDHNNFLPPFLPVDSGEGALWGKLIKIIKPNSLFHHIPAAVLNNPPEKREGFKHNYLSGERRPSKFIEHILEMISPSISGLTPETRLIQTGRALLNYAELETTAFEDFIRGVHWYITDQTRRRISTLLEKYNYSPRHWAKDMEKLEKELINNTISAINSSIYFYDHYNNAIPLPLFQKLLRLYGELLTKWPEIITTADIINEAILEKSRIQ